MSTHLDDLVKGRVIPFKPTSKVYPPYPQSPIVNVNAMQFIAATIMYFSEFTRVFLIADAGIGKTRMAGLLAAYYLMELLLARQGMLSRDPKYRHIHFIGVNSHHVRNLKTEVKKVVGSTLIPLIKFTDRTKPIEDYSFVVIDESQDSINDEGEIKDNLRDHIDAAVELGIMFITATPVTNDDSKLMPVKKLFYNNWSDPRVGIVYVPSTDGLNAYYLNGFLDHDDLNRELTPKQLEKKFTKTTSIGSVSVELVKEHLTAYRRASAAKDSVYVNRDAVAISLSMDKIINPAREDDIVQHGEVFDDIFERHAPEDGSAPSVLDNLRVVAEIAPKIASIYHIHRMRPGKMLVYFFFTTILSTDAAILLGLLGYRDAAPLIKKGKPLKKKRKYYLFVSSKSDVDAHSSYSQDTNLVSFITNKFSEGFSFTKTPTMIIAARTFHAGRLQQAVARIFRYGQLPEGEQAIAILASHSYKKDGSRRLHHEHKILKQFTIAKLSKTTRKILELRDLSIVTDYIPGRKRTVLDPASPTIKEGRLYKRMISGEFPLVIAADTHLYFSLILSMMPKPLNLPDDDPLKILTDRMRARVRGVTSQLKVSDGTFTMHHGLNIVPEGEEEIVEMKTVSKAEARRLALKMLIADSDNESDDDEYSDEDEPLDNAGPSTVPAIDPEDSGDDDG